MPIQEVLAIGHITEDIAEPVNIPGGGVAYGSVTAHRIYEKKEVKVGIATKIPKDHIPLDVLINKEITIMEALTSNPQMTKFHNIFDSTGHRTLKLYGRQDDIGPQDLKKLKIKSKSDTLYLVAPVINEVKTNVIPMLAKNDGFVAVIPQGYFRKEGQNGVVYQKEWSGFEKDLNHAKVTVLSDEDITLAGVFNEGLLNRLIDSCEVVVLTQGSKGATAYLRDKNRIVHAPSFHLEQNETKELTGAGDTFAMAFIIYFAQTGDIKGALHFAHYFTAVKITGLAGVGINSIPTMEQVHSFRKTQHPRSAPYTKYLDAFEKAF